MRNRVDTKSLISVSTHSHLWSDDLNKTNKSCLGLVWREPYFVSDSIDKWTYCMKHVLWYISKYTCINKYACRRTQVCASSKYVISLHPESSCQFRDYKVWTYPSLFSFLTEPHHSHVWYNQCSLDKHGFWSRRICAAYVRIVDCFW